MRARGAAERALVRQQAGVQRERDPRVEFPRDHDPVSGKKRSGGRRHHPASGSPVTGHSAICSTEGVNALLSHFIQTRKQMNYGEIHVWNLFERHFDVILQIFSLLLLSALFVDESQSVLWCDDAV